MRKEPGRPNNKLRQERKLRGWSQRRVAEEIGTAEDQVSRWETGATPGTYYQEALCKLFEKNAVELGFIEPLSHALPADLQEDESDSNKSSESVNRRDAAQKIGILSLTCFAFPIIQNSQILHKEEILSLCTVHIPICWRLYFDGHLSEIPHNLFPLLSQFPSLVEEAKYRKIAASWASKAFQLAAVLKMHHQNLGIALIYAKQGEAYGVLAEDPCLQLAALIQQGNIHFALKQSLQELEAYQRAYQLCREVKGVFEISPLLEGRVNIGLAKAYAKFEREVEALEAMERAYQRYPENPENDPAFSYSCHTRFTLKNHSGLTYLNLGRFKDAKEVFTAIDKMVPQELVPRRAELSLRQATIFFALDEMRESCTCLETAVTAAKVLGSDLRFYEAYELYLSFQEKWRAEQPIQQLKGHFGFPD